MKKKLVLSEELNVDTFYCFIVLITLVGACSACIYNIVQNLVMYNCIITIAALVLWISIIKTCFSF